MIKINAFAKININLHILPKKEGDQFTPLILVNNEIKLHDQLSLTNQKNNIEVKCNPQNDMPPAEDNIIYKTAKIIKEIVGNQNLGVKFFLKKSIPITAGLGGGSSDAAAAINGLKKIWKLKLTNKQIFDIADQMGKDVPYFLKGGLCKLTGFGDIATNLNIKLPQFYLVIVYPNKSQKPSTKWMFQNLDFSVVGKNVSKIPLLINAIKTKNKDKILKNLHNDFEPLVFSTFPEVQKITTDLSKIGASRSLLAGSGLGIVGFFKTYQTSKNAYNHLSKKYSKIFLTKTL